MLSFRFPIPIANSLSPLKPKSLHFSHPNKTNSVFFSPESSLPKLNRLLPTATEVNNGSVGGAENSPEGDQLPAGLRGDLMPKHVAVIMDGNVRWARARGLLASSGHKAGSRSLRQLVELCWKWGIKVLTVFLFSYDNWNRPKDNVAATAGEKTDFKVVEQIIRKGIRISMIGDLSKLPKSLQKIMYDAQEITKNNSRLQLIAAVSYSGQYDIVQACKSIASKVRDGTIELEDINDSVIEQELETNCTDFPYPDLLIRTSGELRASAAEHEDSGRYTEFK